MSCARCGAPLEAAPLLDEEGAEVCGACAVDAEAAAAQRLTLASQRRGGAWLLASAAWLSVAPWLLLWGPMPGDALGVPAVWGQVGPVGALFATALSALAVYGASGPGCAWAERWGWVSIGLWGLASAALVVSPFLLDAG